MPIYERLRLPGMPGEYAAFTSVSEPVPREPNAVADLSIVVDAANGTVSWEIDGQVVAAVERTGLPASGWAMAPDRGGAPQEAAPRQLLRRPGHDDPARRFAAVVASGLVHIGVDLVSPTEFHGGPTLFGQGVQLDVEEVRVEAG